MEIASFECSYQIELLTSKFLLATVPLMEVGTWGQCIISAGNQKKKLRLWTFCGSEWNMEGNISKEKKWRKKISSVYKFRYAIYYSTA